MVNVTTRPISPSSGDAQPVQAALVNNICFGPYVVIVSEDRADEAKAVWDGLDEYESHSVIKSAFVEAGFEVADEREAL